MSKAFDDYLKKRRGESGSTLSSLTSKGTMDDYIASRRNDFASIADDERQTRKVLNDVYSNWQSSESMAEKRNQIESMYNRLGAYNNHGGNVTSVMNAYKNALDNWDSISNVYGQYKNADAYNYKRDENEWVKNNKGLSYDEVQDRLKTAKGNDAYFLSRYGLLAGYDNLSDYDKELSDFNAPSKGKKLFNSLVTKGINNTLGDYTTEEDYYADLSKKRNLYQMDHAYDEYKDLIKNPDFKEKSETEYKELSPIYGMSASASISGSSNKYADVLAAMTDEEKKVANYIGNSYGSDKYKEYMDNMRNFVQRRAYEEMAEPYLNAAGSLAGGAALTLGSYATNLISEPLTLAEEAAGLVGGKYSPYTGMSALNSLTSDVREKAGQSLAEAFPNANVAGVNVPEFLYQTANSTIDSIVGARVLYGIGMGATGTEAGGEAAAKALSIFMGGGAFNNAYREGIEKGLSEDQAYLIGLSNGINEALFEEISLDRLVKEHDLDTLKKSVLNVLTQAGVEGSEEVFTDIANTIAENVILGNQSEMAEKTRELKARGYSDKEIEGILAKEYAAQLAESFLGGALSGGAMGASFTYSKNSPTSYTANKEIGKEISKNKRESDLGNIAENIGNSEAGDYLSKLNDKYGNDLSKAEAAELGVLYKKSLKSAYEAVAMQDKKDLKHYAEGMLLAYGENDKKASVMAETIAKKLTGEALDADDDNILKIDNVKSVVDEIRNYGAGEDSKELTKAIKNISDIKELSLRKEGSIKAAELKDNGKVVITNQDGTIEKTKLSKLDPRTSALIKEADNYTGAVKDIFLSNYGGQNLSLYANAFDLIEKSGEAGSRILEDENTLNSLSKIIPKDTIVSIYKEGMKLGSAKTEEKLSNLTEAKKKWEGQFRKGTFTTTIDRSKLSNNEKMAYDIAEAFSSLGINIKLINNPELKTDGSYNVDRNEVTFNLASRYFKSGDINTAYVITAMSHELTHWMEYQDIKAGHENDGTYSLLKGLIKRDLGEKWDKYVKDQQNKHAENHKNDENYKPMSVKDAESEVVARACENMLNDSETLARVLRGADDTLIGRINNAIKEFFDAISDIIKEILGIVKSGSDIAKEIEKMDGEIDRLRNVWIKGFSQALEYNQKFDQTIDKVGLITDGTYVYPTLNSQQTFSESDYATNEKAAAKAIAEKIGVSQKVALEYIHNVGGVAQYIREHSALLDYTAIEGKSAWVSNPEYGGSLDYSFLCPKRLTYTGTMNAIRDSLLKKNMDIPFSVTDFLFIRSSLKSHGVDSPCSFCFVESARMRFDKYNKKFIKNAIRDGLEYIPTFAELNNPDALEKMRSEHKETYDAYISYLNTLSQRKPKMLEERRAYNGDILKAFTSKDAEKGSSIKDKNRHGGIRFNSFSDFEVVHMIDGMQAILDMSRIGLAGFGYTKQRGFAEVFGTTGLKINLSCVAKGVSADGMHIEFDDYEGMNSKDAIEIRNNPMYSKNVGICCVVFTDEQLMAALCDERIDYVLPFHRSQWSSADYAKLGLPERTKDYTKAQTEKGEDNKRLKEGNTPFLTYWNFKKDGKWNVQNYLNTVINSDKEKATKPIFSQVLDQDKNGNWIMYKAKDNSIEEQIKEKASDNYWKLLTEFKLYDNEGNPSDQYAVKPNFNMEAAYALMDQYDGSHTAFPVDNETVNEFIAYKENGTIPSGDVFDGFRAKSIPKFDVKYLKDGDTKLSNKKIQAEDIDQAIMIATDKGLNVDIEATMEFFEDSTSLNSEQVDYAPIFYSKMEREISSIKSDKIGAASVVSYLKGKGIKDEEIKWSGIETFLEGKKSVTKSELSEFVNGNQIKIEEKTLSQSSMKSFDNLTNLLDSLGIDYSYEDWIDPMDEEFSFNSFSNDMYERMQDEEISDDQYNELITEAQKITSSDNTRWSDYITEGTTNYRELVFKLPGATYSNKAMNVHWGEAGVLAHARIGDQMTSDGKRMLFVEEIQSDWHNEGAKKGYREKHKYDVSVEDKLIRLIVDGEETKTVVLKKNYETVINPWEHTNEYDTDKALEDLIKWHERKNESVPDAPFANGKYIEYVMKRLLRMAAEQGYDYVGWTTAQMQSDRWSDEYAEGYRIEYDQDIPKFMNKYGKQWNVKVEEVGIGSIEPEYFDKSEVYAYAEKIGVVDAIDAIEDVIDNLDGTYTIEYYDSKGVLTETTIEAPKGGESKYTVHSMAVTKAMKESVLFEGQSLFSDQLSAPIYEGMPEEERAEILSKANVKFYIHDEEKKPYMFDETIKELSGKEARKLIDTLAKSYEVFKKYRKETIGIEFNFSKSSLDESIGKLLDNQKTYSALAKILADLDKVIEYSIPLEVHADKYVDSIREDKTLKQVYVLLGGVVDKTDVIPVQLEIKEFTDKDNKLYLVITLDTKKADVFGLTTSKKDALQLSSAFEVSLTNLIETVNIRDKFFLKYIPDQLLSEEQKIIKKEALEEDERRIAKYKKGDRGKELDSEQVDAKTDDWLSAISINDLIDELIDIELSTPKAQKVRAEKRIDEVKERLKTIGLTFDGTTVAGWTDENIEKNLERYASSNKDYAQAYIAYMRPMDFLNLTMGGNTATVDRIESETAGYGALDLNQLGSTNIPMYLIVDEGRSTITTGHEGRHRMLMLGRAGFEKVPVLIFNYDNKYSKEAKANVKIKPQTFFNGFVSPTRSVMVDEMIPFSNRNKDLIISKFGKGNESARVLLSEQEDLEYNELRKAARALEKQNSKLKDDIANLEAMLKLDKTITKGKVLNPTQLREVAKELIEETGSSLTPDQVVRALKETYDYIIELPRHSDDARFNETINKAKKVARMLLEKQKGSEKLDVYSKQVIDAIRKSRIRFDDVQKAEAINQLGSRYRDSFMGSVVIVKDGIELDSWWQDMAVTYPGLFDPDVNSADMPMALLDIIRNLKANKYDKSDSIDVDDINYVAESIYEKFWKIATYVSTADKYEAKISKLKAEHDAYIKKLNKSYADNVSKRIAYVKQQQKESDKDYWKGRLKEDREKLKEAAARKATIEKITKNVMDLNKWSDKPDKNHMVPAALQGPVRDLLLAIDFSSKQLLGMTGGHKAGTPTRKDISFAEALEHLSRVITDVDSAQQNSESTDLSTYLDLPPQFALELSKLSGQVNDISRKIENDNAYVLNQMSLEQLESLLTSVKLMKKAVTNFNKLLANANAHSVDAVAQKTIEYAKRIGSRKLPGSKALDFFSYEQALPYYAFKRFGDGAAEIFTELEDGWDQFAYDMKIVKDYAESIYNSKQVNEWSNKLNTIKVLEPKEDGTGSEERTLTLTTAQIMSLYCLSKRNQAKSHLLGGGIVPTTITVKDKAGFATKKIEQPNAVRITDTALDEILSLLTDEQIEVADNIQKFMNTTLSDWGNDVTMKRFGILGYTEENYFPIKSDSNIVGGGMRDNEKSIYALLNMSFTKALTKNANNQIMVDDIFSVFAVHASDMAKYHSIALPVLDVVKWWNYKEKNRNGRVDRATKIALEDSFGKAANSYIFNFLSDLNGNKESRRGESLQRKMLHNYKSAAVGANLQVALLQPLSYIRAYNVMDAKYLNKALTMNIKNGMKESSEYSGLTIWKDFGFFSTDVSRGLDSLIRQDQSAFGKAVEKSMELAGKMDAITWGILWNAATLEVRETRSDLVIGTDDYYKAVNDRMRDVIYQTQVIDSTMTRSDVMRSQSLIAALDSAFLSEPTISYNVFMDRVSQYVFDSKIYGKGESFKRHGKSIAKAMELYLMSALVESALRTVIGNLRGSSDDDKELWQQYYNQVMEELNPLTKIPYIKSAVEVYKNVMEGYSNVRMDEQWMASYAYAIKALMKAQDEGWSYKTTHRIIKAISQMSGVPLGSALTEIITIWNLIFGNAFPDLKIEK